MVELTAGETHSPASDAAFPPARRFWRWRGCAGASLSTAPFAGRPKTGRQAVGVAFGILLRLIVWPFIALMVAWTRCRQRLLRMDG